MQAAAAAPTDVGLPTMGVPQVLLRSDVPEGKGVETREHMGDPTRRALSMCQRGTFTSAEHVAFAKRTGCMAHTPHSTRPESCAKGGVTSSASIEMLDST